MVEFAAKLDYQETYKGYESQNNTHSGKAKLSVRDLVVTFENTQTGELTEAVNKVSLDIQAGEFVTIVGLSGCGKSSFLNVIAGLLKQKGGNIKLNGHAVNGPGKDRTVVFQKPSLLPWRTVFKNVVYGLELRGMKQEVIKRQAQKYIEMVHLSGFENYYPHQLSGGMQQRVNLARALACEPEVLLLDEPFAALDAITRESMQNELLLLWEQTQKTVLMVTHQIDEAVLLSDRVIVFSPRPAMIVEEIKVNIPRPRTPALRNNAEFDFLNKKIWDLIHRSAGSKVNIEYEI